MVLGMSSNRFHTDFVVCGSESQSRTSILYEIFLEP